MRQTIRATVILSVLLLPTTIFSQDHLAAPSGKAMSAEAARAGDGLDRRFDFNGNASLRISYDSMTDRRVCYASTQNFEGAWIMATAQDAALISLMDRVYLDYTRPALLRIGDDAPFALSRSRQPHAVGIPPSRVKQVVRALYTQQRVRVRIVEWPDGAIFDGEIKPGDFAAAYDKGVELCAWPKLSVAAVHPPETDETTAPEKSEADAAYALETERAQAARLRMFVSSAEQALRQKWIDLIFPAWSRSPRVSARCVVSFAVEPDGAVKDVQIVLGSGDASVDESAKRAVLALPSSQVLFPSGQAAPIAVRADFDWAAASVKISL